MTQKRWQHNLCIFALVALLLANVAQAQEPTLFSGQWSTLLGVDTRAEAPQEDIAVLRSRLDLDVRHPLDETWKIRLGARLHYRASLAHDGGGYSPSFTSNAPDFGLRYDQFAEVRHAFVQYQGELGTITVGNDIAQWGALELQSPLRILNPQDYSLGLLGALGSEETLAIPDFMLRWSHPLGAGAIELICQPFFAQHRFSPFATDTAMVRPDLGPQIPSTLYPMLRQMDLRLDRHLGETLMLALKPPSASPLNASLAGRLQQHVGKWDFALDAIWNWDRLPQLHFDKDVAFLLGKFSEAGFNQQKQLNMALDPEVQAASKRADDAGKGMMDLVTATFQRRLVFGLEWGGEIAEGLMIRGDIAVTPRIGTFGGRVLFDAQFNPVVSSMWQAGAGFEYQHDDWLVAIAEANYQFASDVPKETQLFLMSRQQVTLVGGLVLRLGEGQPWTLQLGGMYGATLGDYAVAPRVTYEFSHSYKLGLGAAVAGGPATSPGGLFRTDDQILLDLRKAF